MRKVKRIKKNCLICNKEFEILPGRRELTAKFCSCKCSNKYLGIKRIDHIVTEETRKKIGIGNSISLKGNIPWNIGLTKETDERVKKGGLNTSKSLKKYFQNNHPANYIDGRSLIQSWNRYGDDWNKIRQLVLIRDNYTCQDCGKHNCLLHIHHKTLFLQSKDNSLVNLITLCPKCHRIRDTILIKQIKSEMRGL